MKTKIFFFIALVMSIFVSTKSFSQISDSIGKWNPVITLNNAHSHPDGRWSHGIAGFLDKQDNLFVISSFNNQLFRYVDKGNKKGLVYVAGHKKAHDRSILGEFASPTCGVFLTENIILIAEAWNDGRIQAIEVDKKGKAVKFSVFDSGLNQVMSLVKSKESTKKEQILYVVESGANRILKYVVSETDTVKSVYLEGLNCPYDMVECENGDKFIAEYYSNRIIKVSQEGTISHFWGNANGLPGRSETELCGPSGLMLVGKILIITDDWNHRYIALDIESKESKLFAGNKDCSKGEALGKFDCPQNGILSKKEKSFFTTEYWGNRIQRYDFKDKRWYYVVGRVNDEILENYEEEPDTLVVQVDEIPAKEPIIFDDNIRVFAPSYDDYHSEHNNVLYFEWNLHRKDYGGLKMAETYWGPQDGKIPTRSSNGYLQKVKEGQYIRYDNGTVGLLLQPYLAPLKPKEKQEESVPVDWDVNDLNLTDM
ncbi:MAG: hypothetical protein WC603_01910 [Candidatus Paceibacterota bacterium]|jgi:hypothetical protein